MKKKFIVRKIRWIVFSCCLVLIVCSTLYFSGVLLNINNEKIHSVVSFISQNSHTGLSDPVSQIALNDRDKAGSQFASNPKNQIPDKPVVNKQIVALDNTPIVLFDISVQPIFEKNNAVVILIWTALFLLFLLVPAELVYIAYKKAKIKKIKGN